MFNLIISDLKIFLILFYGYQGCEHIDLNNMTFINMPMLFRV